MSDCTGDNLVSLSRPSNSNDTRCFNRAWQAICVTPENEGNCFDGWTSGFESGPGQMPPKLKALWERLSGETLQNMLTNLDIYLTTNIEMMRRELERLNVSVETVTHSQISGAAPQVKLLENITAKVEMLHNLTRSLPGKSIQEF